MHSNDPNKQLWVILLTTFLGFLGISIPYLIFPALFINPEVSFLPKDWDASLRAIWLGVTLAAYPFGQFIGAPILGALSDDYGRKRLLFLSLLIAAFFQFATGFALAWSNLTLVIIGRFATGLMEGNIAISRAIVSDLKTISKHESFGKLNAASSGAYLFGPLIGGLLTDPQFIEGTTHSTPFYLIGIMLFVVAFFAYTMLNEDRHPQSHDTKILFEHFLGRLNFFKKIRRLFENQQLKLLMIVSTLFTLAIDIFYEFGPVHLTAIWMTRPSQLIIYNAILCLTLVIGNGWLASYVSKHYCTKRATLFSMGALALFLLIFAYSTSPYLSALLMGLCGLMIGVGVTLITVKISDSAPVKIQGEVMGVQASLRVLGDAIICILGGILLMSSSKLVLILAAVISAGTMGYSFMVDKQGKSLFGHQSE